MVGDAHCGGALFPRRWLGFSLSTLGSSMGRASQIKSSTVCVRECVATGGSSAAFNCSPELSIGDVGQWFRKKGAPLGVLRKQHVMTPTTTALDDRALNIEQGVRSHTIDENVWRGVVSVTDLVNQRDPIVVNKPHNPCVGSFEVRNPGEPEPPRPLLRIGVAILPSRTERELRMTRVPDLHTFNLIPVSFLEVSPGEVLPDHEREIIWAQVTSESKVSPLGVSFEHRLVGWSWVLC